MLLNRSFALRAEAAPNIKGSAAGAEIQSDVQNQV